MNKYTILGIVPTVSVGTMQSPGHALARHVGLKPDLRSFVLLALLTGLAWRVDAMAATAPSLGIASTFAVLGGATVTNTGATTINGDMGVWPGTITGTSPTVTGTIHPADAIAQNAQTDVTAAYDALVAQACDYGPIGATDLAGSALTPGVYCYSSTLANTGLLTLDAQGDSNAVWVFKIGSTLTTASDSSVLVINGGQSSNVFWQVGSSATLGTNTAFAGNILALTSITVNTGATMSGRILARNGTVTLDTNTISLSPIITFFKSVTTSSDPVNGTSNPMSIPGSEMLYIVTVTNSGYGVAGTTVITDQIPANMSMCVSTLCSDPAVVFSCSAAPACGLTDPVVTYSNQPGGGAPYDYDAIPAADANGYNANVTGVQINPVGIFNGASGGNNSSFSLSLKMMIK